MLKMFEASRCLGREGCCRGRSAEMPESCQWDSFTVDTMWPSNVLFTGKTLSPSVNWESIHACGKRCPLGECFCALWLPPPTGNPEALGEGCEDCRFHTSRCRMTPIFPHQRVDSSFSSLWLKASERIWGRLLWFSRGQILKDQKFPKTELYSSSSVSACLGICWIERPPFSLVMWIEACLYNIKSDIETIIFSLKKSRKSSI